MNWEKIKEKYPKAYREFQKFLGSAFDENFWTLSFTTQIGHFFKFFDERGIIVASGYGDDFQAFEWEILLDEFKDDETTSVKEFSVFYSSFGAKKTHPDRPSALKEGFEKAFEILENTSIKST